MPTSAIRLNMTSTNNDQAFEAQRYQAAIEIAKYADKNGYNIVNMEEHHCAENGWMASPLTMVSAIAGATENINISVCALLITLYDPVRLAEDIAVIDVISKGRFTFIAGQGYRPIEYHAMDKSWKDRGKGMDLTIETMLKAWTGEPFEYKGETVRVSPKPMTQPHPMMLVGGMGKNAARRAAKFGLPFFPPAKMAELEALYYSELEKHGNTGFVTCPEEGTKLSFIQEDPDKAWDELGQYLLNETQEYARWEREGVPRPFQSSSDSTEELRDQGIYEFISPEECLQRIEENPNHTTTLHPLVGGMPLDKAWECMELYTEKVLKKC